MTRTYIVTSGDRSVEIEQIDGHIAILEAIDLHGYTLPIVAYLKSNPAFSAGMTTMGHVDVNRQAMYKILRGSNR